MRRLVLNAEVLGPWWRFWPPRAMSWSRRCDVGDAAGERRRFGPQALFRTARRGRSLVVSSGALLGPGDAAADPAEP